MRTLAAPLGRLLVSAIPRDQSFDIVAPVPLHWRRRLARGFNQSELLARAVARRYGLRPIGILKRRRWTAVQAGLTHARRRANVAGAFVAPAKAVRGRRVLLVDDVMTTGATLAACAGALKRAGARYVAVLTLARVDRRSAALPYPPDSVVVGAL